MSFSTQVALVGPLATQPDVIGHHVVVVPGEQLPLSQVVVDHAVVAVLVPEGDGNGLPLTGFGVIHVVNDCVGCRVAGHSVQLSADDEGIGNRVLPDVGLPAPLHLQTVWIQLRDHDGSFGFAGGVDSPQPLLIHSQVDVSVTSPGVGESAMEASVGKVTTGRDALRGQVVADEGAAATSLKIQRASVQSGPSALHLLWQQQDLSWENMTK